ncbi:MAG: acyl-CoA desaturase [Bacteroidota bacterium]
MAILIFFLAHWYLSIFMQTFYLHRYAAHGMFRMSPFWERFFWVLTYISQGSSYLSPRVYGILHRMHHAYADTEMDPHSPKYSDNMFSMMFDTSHVYGDIKRNRTEIDPRFTKNVPTWTAMDKIADNPISRFVWMGLYVWFYVAFAEYWWMYALLPIHFMMGPVHGVIINWFAHKYGYRNFEVEDTSTNFLPFDFLTMGEAYHNNHHTHSGRANFGGFRWHELDLSWLIIQGLDKIGVLKLKRKAKEKPPMKVAA